MYRRRSVGGNISSANGVIKSFHENGYNVDILSDDIVPGLDNHMHGIKFIFFPYAYLRELLKKI